MYRVDTIYKSRKLDTEGIKRMYRKSPLLYLNLKIYTISKRGCKQQTKEYQVLYDAHVSLRAFRYQCKWSVQIKQICSCIDTTTVDI